MNVIASRPKTARLLIILLLVLVACIVVVLANPLGSYLTDSGKILYRYAEQIRAGNGAVFNPDERNLLMAAPAYIVLLGISAAVLPSVDVISVSQLLFALMIVIGAVAIHDIARRGGFGRSASVGLAALYFAAWPLWAAVGTAYPAMSALSLVAFALALGGHWRWSGVLLALACLCSPEALLLAIPLALLAANQGRAMRFGLALVLPLLAALILLRFYYGPTLWDGLLILKDHTPVSFPAGWLTLLSLPLLGLAAWGWLKGRASPELRVVTTTSAGWIVLYLVVMVGLLRVDALWKYAPIVSPVLLLAGIGLRSLQPTSARIIAVMGATLLLVASLLVMESAPRMAPVMFPAPAQRVGVNTVGQVWGTAISTNQRVISFDGQLQPELKAILERGDTESALIRYAPDVMVIGDTGRIHAKDLSSVGVARLQYSDKGQAGMFVRGVAIGSFADLPADAQYGPDVHLSGMALDQTSLKPGQVFRVRLDWQLARQADKPVTVDLWLRSGEYLLAHTVDTYDAAVFKPGAYSTYHTLAVLGSAWSGPVTLEVAIIVNNGVVARYPLATLQIVGS